MVVTFRSISFDFDLASISLDIVFGKSYSKNKTTKKNVLKASKNALSLQYLGALLERELERNRFSILFPLL